MKLIIILGTKKVVVNTFAGDTFAPEVMFQLASRSASDTENSVLCETGLCLAFRKNISYSYLNI